VAPSLTKNRIAVDDKSNVEEAKIMLGHNTTRSLLQLSFMLGLYHNATGSLILFIFPPEDM